MNFIAEVDELFYEAFIPKATKSRVQKYEYEHVIGVEDGDEHMVRANVGTVVVVDVLSGTVSTTHVKHKVQILPRTDGTIFMVHVYRRTPRN